MNDCLFLVIRGLPGIGKSTLAKTIAGGFGQEHCLFLDPDRVDLKLVERSVLLKHPGEEVTDQKLIYRHLLSKARNALLEGKIVIWDQPWRSLWGIRVTVNKLQEFLAIEGRENLCLRLIILEFAFDQELARHRLQQRLNEGKHGPTPRTFERFVSEFEKADPNEFNVFYLDARKAPAELAGQARLIIEKISRVEPAPL